MSQSHPLGFSTCRHRFTRWLVSSGKPGNTDERASALQLGEDDHQHDERCGGTHHCDPLLEGHRKTASHWSAEPLGVGQKKAWYGLLNLLMPDLYCIGP